MGGTSTTSQTSNQQSQLTPYAPAQAGLQGILGALGGMTSNLGVTPGITNAFGQIEQNSGAANPYSAPAGASVLSQLSGGPNFGTATNTVGNGASAVSSALSPFTTGNSLDPASNPALAQQLNTVNQQVQNTVNPAFSAAGRLASPANAQAMATGIAQGDTGILQNAAGNQISAAGVLGNNANNAGGILGNLDVGNAGIQTAGLNNAPNAFNLPNLGPQTFLNAALQQNQLPISNASQLSGILGPIAAQFGTQTGSGTQTGTSTMSPMQQLLMGSQAFSNFLNPFKSAPTAGMPAGGGFS